MRIVEVSDGEVAEAVRADHADTRNLAEGAGAAARMAERERMAAGGSA